MKLVETRMDFTKEELKEIYEVYYEPLTHDIFKQRIHGKDDITRKRNDYQRDYTRIIYSSSFRRLQGKMQLLGLQSDMFFRNRLTHSLEVAQIARSIAEDIGHDIGLVIPDVSVYAEDTYVVEAGSLAHDIGNPPFGHKGERILHDLCSDDYGFEGNAQTLRVLMEIEKKYADFRGLNLTLRTLLGVTKYYKKFEFKKSKKDTDPPSKYKKFIYADTYDILNEIISTNSLKLRTLDVQIVDLSDEIAYAAHDLEDALSLNLFTIDELLYEFSILSEKYYPNAYTSLETLVKESKEEGAKARRMGSSEEYSYLFRKSLTAKIVNILIHDIGLIEVNEKHIEKTGTMFNKELGFKTLGGLARGLKETTFKCINRKNHVKIYEAQGKKVILGLFEVFMSHDKYLPVEFRSQYESDIQKKRLVIDYIAGMMDSFAISSYIKFYGKESLDALYINQHIK